MLWLAKEVGLVGREAVDDSGHLLGRGVARHQPLDVAVQVGLAGVDGQFLQPTGHQRVLAFGKVDPRDLVKQFRDVGKGSTRQGDVHALITLGLWLPSSMSRANCFASRM